MSRYGRAGVGVLVVVVLYLLGSMYGQVGDLNSKLGNAQGQLAEKDRQIVAGTQALASAQRRLDANSVRAGQYVAIITALTRQLERAGLRPVVRQQDVPNPEPGPPVVTPSPRPSAGPTARPKPKPSHSPTPHPTPTPTPCTVTNPLPTGPPCLVPRGAGAA